MRWDRNEGEEMVKLRSIEPPALDTSVPTGTGAGSTTAALEPPALDTSVPTGTGAGSMTACRGKGY